MLEQATLDRGVVESIKILKANIQFSGIDKPVRSIVVTSSKPSEGKSSIALLLAQSMAEGGKRTLIVDVDLRKPSIGNRLGIRSSIGLVHFISGKNSFDEAIKKTQHPYLHFVDCGFIPPNPVEVVNSVRFPEFHANALENYDYVIYDTPPVGAFIEGAIIAGQADGTVMVIESGEVDHKQAQSAVEQLEKAHARILGVVLNKVKSDSPDYYYDYYYHYDDASRSKRHKKKNARSTEE